MLKLEDDSIMPFGSFKGKTMKEVDDSWLRWFWNTNEGRKKVIGRDQQAVMNYIRENLDAINENLKG